MDRSISFRMIKADTELFSRNFEDHFFTEVRL